VSIPSGGAGTLRGVIVEVGAQRNESVSMAGRNAMNAAAHGALTAVPRAFGIILAVLFAPLRMLLVPSLLGGRGREQRPEHLQVPVTPFIIVDEGGRHHECLLRGEVRGGFLRLGEEVEVDGTRDRSNVFRARRIRSVRSHATISGWVDPRARTARAQTVAGAVFLALLVVIVLVSVSRI
jgi:hypothetical protein